MIVQLTPKTKKFANAELKIISDAGDILILTDLKSLFLGMKLNGQESWQMEIAGNNRILLEDF